MDLVKQLYEEALPLKPCSLFRGTETFREMMQVFLSPQGLEFCISHDFPRDEHLAAIREAGAADMGVHIDEGSGLALNPRTIVLVGDTDFDLFYDTVGYACRVALMKGARCKIHASGYAVVSVTAQPGCGVMKTVRDHAIVR